MKVIILAICIFGVMLFEKYLTEKQIYTNLKNGVKIETFFFDIDAEVEKLKSITQQQLSAESNDSTLPNGNVR
jgi:hypothetical protein